MNGAYLNSRSINFIFSFQFSSHPMLLPLSLGCQVKFPSRGTQHLSSISYMIFRDSWVGQVRQRVSESE